jgi:hypothetical protein
MRSTIGQLRDFKSSVIWTDIVEELEVWLGMIQEQLENADMELSHRHLDRLGGCAEAVRNFSDILTVLVGLAEDSRVERDTILNKLIKREAQDGQRRE